jgi:prolyl-tRNA synthetase
MRYSHLFGKTVYEDQRGSEMISHQLLVRGGFIRESTAGRYFFLPLGWRVQEKIKAIIKQEMDKAGAQEMITPVLHPLELWQETNRTNTTGFELMKVKDRRGAEFALGGTAEEMMVDVVRKFQLSYKDLPFHIYQFSTKFRDELRARGGLLRVREFVMKDGYSFHADKADFEAEYEKMTQTYQQIFARMGLETQVVAADNGYIGGEYCHEFQVEHPEGEGTFFVSDDESYVAHEDVAVFEVGVKNDDEPLLEYQEVEAVRGNTIEDGVALHGLPAWQQLKNVMFADEKGNLVLALIRGDLEVNPTKLLHVSGAARLEPATEAQIRAIGSIPGFISPVGLEGKAKIVADRSIRGVHNFYGGANKKNTDALNMNIDRDFSVDVEADIAQAFDGAVTAEGKKLIEKRGIEVGNIFQLGYHYSSLMSQAVFVETDGTTKPYYMGCYGIGLGRTLATIVEKYHDEKGIVWPDSVAPYQVHMLEVGSKKNEAGLRAEDMYHQLIEAGVEVLWDDREVSPGVKFADADLIGMPIRLVISPRNGDLVEWKRRDGQEVELLAVDEVIQRLKG